MDTNKRYNRERQLSEQLNELEEPLTKMDITSFERLLDNRDGGAFELRKHFWVFLLLISVTGVVGFYFVANSDKFEDTLLNGMDSNQINMDVGDDIVSNIQSSIEYNKDPNIASTSKRISVSALKQSEKIPKKLIGENNSRMQTYAIDLASDHTNLSNDIIEDERIVNDGSYYNLNQDENPSLLGSNRRVNQTISNFDLSEEEQFDIQVKEGNTRTNLVNFNLLRLLNHKLKYEYALESPRKNRDVIEVDKPKLKRTSFGFNYSIGTLYANTYVPRALANFPVEVSDGETLSFGLFGQYQFTEQLFVRPSFMYHRLQQLQYVHGMRFMPLGPEESAKLEATSHELDISLQLGYSVLYNFIGFNVSVGFGTGYSYGINLASDNIYLNPDLNLNIENATNAEIASMYYSTFILIEKNIGDLVLGISPNFRWHDRLVSHQSSFMLADDAKYDKQSSITFSLRFK